MVVVISCSPFQKERKQGNNRPLAEGFPTNWVLPASGASLTSPSIALLEVMDPGASPLIMSVLDKAAKSDFSVIAFFPVSPKCNGVLNATSFRLSDLSAAVWSLWEAR